MPNFVNPYLYSKPFLFDVVSGAEFGFSLRKLSSTYSGSCIQVTRSSDSTSKNIGFVNNFLDTIDLLSFCGSSTGWVTKWYDQTGNGYDFTQAVTANAPIICASGVLQTNTFNSQVALNTTGKIMTASKSWSGVNITCFCVSLKTTAADRFLVVNNVLSWAIRANINVNNIEIFAGASVQNTSVPIPINIPGLWKTNFNGASSNWTVNGATSTSGNPGSNPVGTLTINGAFSNYQEIVFYPLLSSGNQTLATNNINNYYSVY